MLHDKSVVLQGCAVTIQGVMEFSSALRFSVPGMKQILDRKEETSNLVLDGRTIAGKYISHDFNYCKHMTFV